MLRLSDSIDLGGDKDRMTDPRDVARQTSTARAILRRFSSEVGAEKAEIQVLADEVGMGKTFVALAVAHSVLQGLREDDDPELLGCYRKVLVLTPNNDTLFRKWARETGEFAKFCVRRNLQDGPPLKAVPCETIDEVVKALRTPNGPGIVIFKTSRLASSSFRNRDKKYQFILSAACRFFGNRFQRDARTVLLKGAPEGWPRDDEELDRIEREVGEEMQFSREECIEALSRLDDDALEPLLGEMKTLAEPYFRDRAERFEAVRSGLSDLYKDVCFELICRDLPLVIVDEAHNWKNGPDCGANGYRVFEERLAPRTRRLLLLTATPFQLAPKEMLNILQPGGHLSVAPERRQALCALTDVLHQVLDASQSASRSFAKAWSLLPSSVKPEQLAETWESPSFERVRIRLKKEAARERSVDHGAISRMIRDAIDCVHPDLRGFFEAALRLYALNADLSAELGRVVIRHRRATDHRLVRVGAEFRSPASETESRQDRSVLHTAPGIDVRDEGELPHYVLMRAVSELKRGKGRTSLGAGLTGTYSTLFESREGRLLDEANGVGLAKLYSKLLRSWTDESRDPFHPKVQALVDDVFAAWQRGEKYLIFCFRVHTARRLRSILRHRIEQEIEAQRRTLLESSKAFEHLRARFTGRERDLIPAVLDRLLWSWVIGRRALGETVGYTFSDLKPQSEDYRLIAQRLLEYGVNLEKEQYDRVFLHRVAEHAFASRLLRQRSFDRDTERMLKRVASRTWLQLPYGVQPAEAQEADDSLQVQRRGVHFSYEPTGDGVHSAEIDVLSEELRRRDRVAKRANKAGPIRGIAVSANFWLGANPSGIKSKLKPESPLLELHKHLCRAMGDLSDESVWHDRLHLFAAFRRAVLRESTLVRLMPTKAERRTRGPAGNWAALLAERLARPLPGQEESYLARLAAFAEDYASRSGGLDQSTSMRWSLMEATLLRDDSLVALVDGKTDARYRDRIFSGFNTPLLPDILICTSVGQEGIDLHRHCRHVAHYDLAWNPAVLEQRTGRADRIGSKTFRERAVQIRENRPLSFLHVGVPYLAGTYDERIYEELRLRSQTFEMLTGGSFSADHADLADEGQEDEGKSRGIQAVTLPPSIISDLRVNLGL